MLWHNSCRLSSRMRWGTSSRTHLLSPVLKIKVITSLVTPLREFSNYNGVLDCIKILLSYDVPKSDKEFRHNAIRSRVFASLWSSSSVRGVWCSRGSPLRAFFLGPYIIYTQENRSPHPPAHQPTNPPTLQAACNTSLTIQA